MLPVPQGDGLRPTRDGKAAGAEGGMVGQKKDLGITGSTLQKETLTSGNPSNPNQVEFLFGVSLESFKRGLSSAKRLPLPPAGAAQKKKTTSSNQ